MSEMSRQISQMAVKGVAGSMSSVLPFNYAAAAVHRRRQPRELTQPCCHCHANAAPGSVDATHNDELCAPQSKIADINLEKNTRAYSCSVL